MAVLSRHHSYHPTYRLAVKDDAAPTDPCWTLCLLLLALGIKRVKGYPQTPAAYTVAVMDSGAKEGEGARRPGPHNGVPISRSRERLNTMMPRKKGTPSIHIFKSRSDSTVKIWPLEPVHDYSRFRGLFVPTLCVVVLDSS
jgi:hypothetical protein